MSVANPFPSLQTLDFSASDERAGFRLRRLEIYNWGTFHERVWSLEARGDNTLLTGDIGSGKSTLVDAVTTLLVAPQKITYNKAAGAEARERTLRSYVLGFYKAERGEMAQSVRPVALRDINSYSVILGQFHNDGFDTDVTLAQVFWLKDSQSQPARAYVVADVPLTIGEHFAGFGTDILDLRKRLRRTAHLELHDSFPPYAAAFRRRMGIDNEQALQLFNQTVSMKSVGNLTDFVREHMLEPFPVEQRIDALIHHFDDLNRAHEAVLKAKAQIALLTPLIADCDRHQQISARLATSRACREALRPWFAGLKAELLERRIENLDEELTRLGARLARLGDKRQHQQAQRDELKRAIAESGGDRLEQLKAQIAQKQTERLARSQRAEHYAVLAKAIGLPGAEDGETFAVNRKALASEREAAEQLRAEADNAHTEASVEFRQLGEQHGSLAAELESLRGRRSNIPARMLELRDRLCAATGLEATSLPFAGELLQVQEDERDWEGAMERLLHSFGLSLLVPNADYARVSAWVDQTHLTGRLVYFRTRAPRDGATPSLQAQSLVRKLVIKPDSAFYSWLESELARRFDYACCTNLDQFRRERLAITRAGQIKGGGGRHEKDDRHRIDDRSRFVLGWSNEAKIEALQAQAETLQRQMQQIGERISRLDAKRRTLQARLENLGKLAVFENFRDLDWRPLVAEIEHLEGERRQLEASSDTLRTLERQLYELETSIRETEAALDDNRSELGRTEEKLERARAELQDSQAQHAAADTDATRCFPLLADMRGQALGEHTLTVESCDNREKDLRDWLQRRIDTEAHSMERLAERIVKTMESYCNRYPVETQEADVSVGAAAEYRTMLDALASDDLPRFEARFKELLNENTIREVANFQSQLSRERQTIRERIETINRSLQAIDYNPGRYIVLEAQASADPDIRDFQRDLRACTEGALTGSEEEEYSEGKFLQVKRIIERFRGREGSTEVDRRWTRKVTDVRNAYMFSASERWREDNSEYEHYADSGGKSGGQKEKLAYTVLAASLAYQFGLEWGEIRSRSFRFVVIDEAFGRGSDESARYGLELFKRLNLQLLIVTPLQKIHIIEPYVASVGFVHSHDGQRSMLRNLTIEEYREERASRGQ